MQVCFCCSNCQALLVADVATERQVRCPGCSKVVDVDEGRGDPRIQPADAAVAPTPVPVAAGNTAQIRGDLPGRAGGCASALLLSSLSAAEQEVFDEAIAKWRKEQRQREKLQRRRLAERLALRTAGAGMRLIYYGSICLFAYVALVPLCAAVVAVLAAQQPPTFAESSTGAPSREIGRQLLQGRHGGIVLLLSFCCTGVQFLAVVLQVGGKGVSLWVPPRAKVRPAIVASFLCEGLGLLLFCLSWLLPFLPLLSPTQRPAERLLELSLWASSLSLVLSLISFFFLLGYLRGLALFLNQKRLANEPEDFVARTVVLILWAVGLLVLAVLTAVGRGYWLNMDMLGPVHPIAWGVVVVFGSLLVAGALGWLYFFLATWLRLIRLVRCLRQAMQR